MATPKLEKKIDEMIEVLKATSDRRPNQQDHDTLTTLVGQVKELDKKMDIMTNKLDNQYVTKEEHKDVVTIQEDHETRIRTQEEKTNRIINYGSAALVFIAIVEFVINKYF